MAARCGRCGRIDRARTGQARKSGSPHSLGRHIRVSIVPTDPRGVADNDATMTTRTRARRSCLAVPGQQPAVPREGQEASPADQVFLDLEDACAPLAKPEARKNIVAALNEGGWGDKIRVVRVNDWTTQWTYRDVIEVVEGAGREPRRDHAAEGADRRAGRGAGPAADPDREDDGLRGRQDRHRGADRERAGPDRRRRDRQGVAARRDDHLRPGRLHGLDQHEVAGRRRAAARLRRGRRLPPHPDVDPDGRPRATTSRPSTGPYLQIRDVDGFRRVAGALGRARLRRQVGAAPRPDRRANEVFTPVAGRLRPRRADPRRLRVLHVRGRRREGLGDARRRDDRRGVAQDGAGHLGQGPRGRHAAHRPLVTPES